MSERSLQTDRRALSEANGGVATDFEHIGGNATLVEVVRWRALHEPRQRAYTFLVDGGTEEVCLTYEALDRQARAIGAWLQNHRASRERALLFYPPGLEFVTAFFGCIYSGVIAVPMPSPDADRRGRTLPRPPAVLNDAQPSVTLTTLPIMTAVRDLSGEAPELSRMRWLATDTVAGELKEEWWDPRLGPEALAYLQYTSGSTMTPRGAMVSHANVLRNSAYISHEWGYTRDSIAVSEQHGLHVYAVSLLEPGSIPKTSSGKIQRHACRAEFQASSLNGVGGVYDESIYKRDQA